MPLAGPKAIRNAIMVDARTRRVLCPGACGSCILYDKSDIKKATDLRGQNCRSGRKASFPLSVER